MFLLGSGPTFSYQGASANMGGATSMARYNKGWVKAWREQVDSDLPANIWLWGIWHWLLLTATWKPAKILWNGKQRDIPAGTVVIGMSELAAKWECSNNTIKRWLCYLANSDRITIESCTRGTLVTIRNWDLYQSNDADECKPSENELQTKCKPSGTYEEGKNKELIKEEQSNESGPGSDHLRCSSVKPSFDLETIYQGYPRKKGKTPGMKKLSKDILSEKDLEQLAAAVANFAKDSAGKEPQYVMHFSTFANQWRDWVNVEPDAQTFSTNTKFLNLEEIV